MKQIQHLFSLSNLSFFTTFESITRNVFETPKETKKRKRRRKYISTVTTLRITNVLSLTVKTHDDFHLAQADTSTLTSVEPMTTLDLCHHS